MSSLRKILPLAAAAAVVAAAVATAEPARTIPLSASAPLQAWEAGPFDSGGTPVINPAPRCSAAKPCDDNLIKVEDAGTLAVDVKSTGTEPDVDLYLYESDATGKEGKELAVSDEVSPDEKVSKAVKPGFYLARVIVYAGLDVMYKGKAELKGAAAAEPAPAPGATPTPAPTGTGGSSGGNGTAPAGPKPGEAPLTATVAVQKARLKVALKKGLPVKITCNTSCQGIVEATISAKDAKRYKLGKKALLVASTKFTPAAGDRILSVKFAKKAAKRLAKAKSLTLSVRADVADAQGGQRRAIVVKAKLKR